MKSKLDHPDETEVIRSEIDHTRQRMDHTIDALGQRLRGRHLLDEALHFFRKQQENGNMTKMTTKISESAGTAYHSVIDTIKSHPVPIALVGAGVGWLIYERTRSSRNTSGPSSRAFTADSTHLAEDYGAEFRGVPPYDDDFAPEPVSGESFRGSGAMAEMAAEIAARRSSGPSYSGQFEEEGSSPGAMQKAKQKASELGGRLRERTQATKESARRAFETSKQKVSTTVQEHPLQSGLAFLAIGLVAGMLIPTPRRFSQQVAPKARELADRAKQAGQDLMNRGSQVVQAATQAGKDEAQRQGLTSSGSGPSGGSHETPMEKGIVA